ncbi:unnamed protein product [Brassica rapa]|uniref:Uncharacterized protein n=1 Tax=Brassica campestris TaxID=3711 RepID=A0A3P5ZB43_BRACM|nr:unnamed protein product [Brassica rapa]VDC77132.1 unnamed protein product [Brassica rapa]
MFYSGVNSGVSKALRGEGGKWRMPYSWKTGRVFLEFYHISPYFIAPATDTRMTPDSVHSMFPYYVDQTTSNLLAMPTGIITADTLKEINGDGDYSVEAIPLDKLTEKELLVLPAGLPIPEVPLEEVGTKKAKNYFTAPYLFSVYILNKAICADTTNNNDVRFGLARMEAVKLGWFSNQRAVKMEPAPNDPITVATADIALITELLAPARDVAWLVPLAAEYTFRTMGHHYLSALKSDYIKGYDDIFKASLMPDVGNFLPSNLLYQSAFHWITPARIWKVMKAHEDSRLLPDAIKLRMTCAPVGAALVTTTAAVLKSFSTAGFLNDLIALNITKIDMIFELDAKIRKSPTVYHRTPTAYDEAFLDAGPRKEFEDGKEDAKKLAPLLQAFCHNAQKCSTRTTEGVPTSLAEVFGQKKKSKATIEDPSGADDNPALRQGTKRFFQEVGRGIPTSVDEVFEQKKSKAAIEDPSGPNESG